VAFELGEECLLAVRAREIGSGREVEVVFTTKGTPDEVRKRVEKEASYAAAGIERPPGAGPAAPAAAGGSREIPRPASPAEPPAGLKGLWGRITGR